MDALALRQHLETAGFRLSLAASGLRVEPATKLTTETRQLIRANRDALLQLVRGSPATSRPITTAEAGIRAGMARLWTRYGWIEYPDYPEALAVALADPGAALDSLRAEGVL